MKLTEVCLTLLKYIKFELGKVSHIDISSFYQGTVETQETQKHDIDTALEPAKALTSGTAKSGDSPVLSSSLLEDVVSFNTVSHHYYHYSWTQLYETN